MSRRTAWAIIALTAVAAFLRAWGLAAQLPTVDDLGVAAAAENWVLHGQPHPSLVIHPRLGSLLVYLSLKLFGNTAWGLKGWSVLFGTLMVPLLAAIVWRLSRNEVAVVVAALLVAFDGVLVDYSRQAIHEVQAAFFALLGTLFVAVCLTEGPSSRWRLLVPAAGVAFGLSLATKLYALPVLVVCMVWLAVAAKRSNPEGACALIAMPLLAFAVYLATYAPWFFRGYSITEWFSYQYWLFRAMMTHTRTTGFLLYDEPYQWFIRPFVGYADSVVAPDGRLQLSVAVGNPLVWLLVLPALAYSLAYKRHRKAHQFLHSCFWAVYLPLVFASRPVWLLSAVTVVPYAFALVGLVAADVARRFGTRLLYTYGVLVVVTSLALYPLAIGRALDVGYLQPIVSLMGEFGRHAPR